MEALIVLAFTFGVLWVLFILPQQRRVRAHQRLVMSLEEGDTVILTAGIFGRIVNLGPEELDLEVAPGVELRVARHAVMRRIERALPTDDVDVDEVDEDEIDERDELLELEDVEEFDELRELDGTATTEDEHARIDTGDADDNNADRPGGDHRTL